MLPKNLITILVDDIKYIISLHTLNQFKDCLLTQVIHGEKTDPYITIVDHQVYVDVDPISFSFVIQKLRGYDFDPNEIINPNLKNKVLSDLAYFGLIQNDILDTSVLLSHNKDNIDSFINTIEERLKTNPYATINALSNDDIVQQIIKSTAHQQNDSDTDSLELEEDFE
jgi:hypothetical protein